MPCGGILGARREDLGCSYAMWFAMWHFCDSTFKSDMVPQCGIALADTYTALLDLYDWIAENDIKPSFGNSIIRAKFIICHCESRFESMRHSIELYRC